MKQPITHDPAVVFECELPEPRDKVWRALTERELLAAWLMSNDIRPEVGAKFQLRPSTGTNATSVPVECEPAPVEREPAPVEGEPAPVECEVLHAERGRLLQWRQREPADGAASRYFIESVVSFELTDAPNGGTHLRVVHDGFTTVARCSTVVAFRPRAKAASTRTSAITTTSVITPTSSSVLTATRGLLLRAA